MKICGKQRWLCHKLMCLISPFGLRPISICIYMELIFQTLPLALFQMPALSCCHDDAIWSHSLRTCSLRCVTALPCSGHKKVPAASRAIPLSFRRIDRQTERTTYWTFYRRDSGGREEKVKSNSAFDHYLVFALKNNLSSPRCFSMDDSYWINSAIWLFLIFWETWGS